MRAFIISLLAAYASAAGTTGLYDYTQGGENWAASGNICGLDTSKHQSPINLLTTDDAAFIKDEDLAISMKGFGALADTDVAYPKESDSNATNTTGHPINWQAVWVGDWVETATVTRTAGDGTSAEYKPLQMHFHTPSEHTVDGQTHDAEVHFVNQSADGVYAVVGVFFKTEGATAENTTFIQDVIDGYQQPANTMDIAAFVSTVAYDGVDMWQYDGSFTTPPCTEGVKWTVLKTPMHITAAQLTTMSFFTKGQAGLADAATMFTTNISGALLS